MDRETLKGLVSREFDEEVEITHFDKKVDRLPLLDSKDYSWRDYLIETSKSRLELGQVKESKPKIIKEIESFLTELKKLPEDAILYIWKAKSNQNVFVGWASEDSIIRARKY